MGYREARELARIRQELRERLMTSRADGAEALLARMHAAAVLHTQTEPELVSEYERWRVRFELLATA